MGGEVYPTPKLISGPVALPWPLKDTTFLVRDKGLILVQHEHQRGRHSPGPRVPRVMLHLRGLCLSREAPAGTLSVGSEHACPLSWRGTRLILRGRRGEQPKEMGQAGKERSGPVAIGDPARTRGDTQGRRVLSPPHPLLTLRSERRSALKKFLSRVSLGNRVPVPYQAPG